MKLTWKRAAAVLMSAALAFGLTACNGGSDASDASGGGEIKVSFPHYKTGENVGAAYFLPMIERFNEKYDGQYEITVEEITQDVYNDRLKLLGQQGKLPIFIEGGDTTWIQDVVIPNNLFYDLKGFVDEHPEIKELIGEDAYNYNLHDGKLVTLMTPVVSPITMFYNEALWKPSKSIAEMSWDDVAADLGDAKIGFMTGENAWTTMLVYSSLIAAEPGGADLLLNGVTEKIMDFNQKPIIDATAKLQKLMQENSTASAVGAAYADAANQFFSNKAAIFPNGSWMVSDFAPESSDKWSNGFDAEKIHGAVLPGNVALANQLGYCYWIPATASDEEVEVALALLEFMFSHDELEEQMLVLGGMIPGFDYSEDFLTKRAENRILDEYMGAVQDDTIIAPALEAAIPSSIASTELGNLLPLLVDGTYTPEQFCQALTDKAAETALD